MPVPRLNTVDLDCELTVDVKSLSEIPTVIKSSIECCPQDLILISAATGCPSSNCNGVLDLHEGFDHIRVLTLEMYGPRNSSCEAVIYYSGINHMQSTK